MPGNRTKLRLVFNIIFLVFFTTEVFLQETSRKLPILDEHEFVPITGAKSPFTHTKFFTYMGYGKTRDFFLPLYQIGDYKVIGLKGDVAFVDLAVNYQQRVRDRLAIYLKYSVAARLGTEVQTVVAQGYTSITSMELGWKIKIIEKQKMALSTTLELQNHTGNFVNVIGFVQDIVNNQPSPSITKKVPVLTGGAGLQFAYSINKVFGLNIHGDFAYGETYIRGENAFRFSAGSSFDVNFYKQFDVPVGVAINFLVSSQPELVYVNGKAVKIFIFKLAYTGASDFSLGLEWAYMITPLPGLEKEPAVNSVGVAMRFYF